MKNLSKLFVSILTAVFLMTSVLSISAFAEKKEQSNTPKAQTENKATKEDKAALQEQKAALQEEKAAIELKKDEAEALKESLETQLEAAVAASNTTLADQLRTQLEEANKNFLDLKQQMVEIRTQFKEIIKSGYTAEELTQLQAVASEITAEDPNATVIPVENIVLKNREVKFDTPPVVKYNRTLIPVRALSEAYGADVQWLPDEKKVVITSGDTVIELQLDSKITYVNGVETAIDVPAESINQRTMVPLRFIVEKLGLKVNWDADTGVIEVDEQAESTETEDQAAPADQTAQAQ